MLFAPFTAGDALRGGSILPFDPPARFQMIPFALAIASLLGGTETAPPAGPVEDAPPVYPAWSGALAFGAVFTDGNSVSDSANATFNAQRRDEKDRYTFDAFWNWAQQAGDTTEAAPVPDEDDTELTQRNYGAGVKYDYFASKRLYWYGNTSGKVDDIAELKLRAILGAGAGYQWKETDKLKWGTEIGLSYVDEDYRGSAFDAEFLAARLGSNLAYQISKSASFEQIAEVLPSLEDSEDMIAKIDNRLKLNITGSWIAQIQYVLDFDGSVPTGSDPGPDGKEETDHRVVVGIGWNLGA